MGVGFLTKTDLYSLYNYVQNTGQAYCKGTIIESLREFFANDSYYRYVRDQWGFPKVVSQEGLALDAGLNDTTSTTRLFIGEAYRDNMVHYPSILIRPGGYRSVPIAFSRDKFTVEWSNILYTDGYGNETYIRTPKYYCQDGAWEGTINVEINSLSEVARDELIDLCMLFFTDTGWEDLHNSGIVIKNASNSGPSEVDDRNKKLFKQTISLEVRTEWLRKIPINSTLDAINICVEIGDIDKPAPVFAPNLQINTSITLAESILSI